MKSLFKSLFCIYLIFYGSFANSYTIPVVDGVRAMEAFADMASAIAALSELAEEFSNEIDFIKEMNELNSIMSETDKIISDIKGFESDYNYVKEFNVDKYNIFVEKIRSITGIIRRVKKMASVVSGAMSSDSLNSIVNILRYERERTEEAYNAKIAIATMKHEARLRNLKVKMEAHRVQSSLKGLLEAEKSKNNFTIGKF